MADSLVSFLLENLTQLLLRESKLLRGVEDQVKSLEKELYVIKIFLRNADGKRHDELGKDVVSQIRDVAYEAEDVIDTYIITVAEHRGRSKLRKLIHSCDRAITFHEFANKIERIRINNKEIDDIRSKYGTEIVESSGGNAEAEETLHWHRKYVEEDQVVGFNLDAEVLMKVLMEGSLQWNVVSIIGMGGLGKTTLARKIYNNNYVKNYFNFRGWVYVSLEYRIRELLLEILKGLSPLPRVMLRAELKEKLLHGLDAKYSSNNDKLKGRLTEDFKSFKDGYERFKEMDDKQFKKAWSEFLKGIQDYNGLKNSLSNFVQEFYKENGVELTAELKEVLLHDLYATYSSNIDKLEGTLIEDLKRFKEMNERFKEMNDEEFRKAWSEFLEGVQDCNDLKNLLSNFVQDFYSENRVKLEDMTEDDLKSVLFESLRDKRYLLVMDDIWNNEVWNEVSTAFPNNSNGSRILITTRIKEVSLHASSVYNSVPPIPPYELPLLKEDESWELFSKKVFWEGICPPELETLGRQLVKSCHGLPLAIVVLGDVLASKEKTYQIWSKYVGHINSYLTDNRSSCIDILALSYNHLPRYLKPCFLYFGIYPKDFEIPVRQLIRLWIAEGFICQIGNRNIEDVAEHYLEELIDRSLIQVATKRLDGGVKTCRIHDLLRDLCILESSEEKFLEVHSNVNLSPIGKSRRISIHYGNNPYISSSPPLNSRSIIVFRGVVEHECPLDKSYLKWICESNKLVRVIELSNMGIRCLIPKGIEKLVLLRYLSISSGELHDIPNSICNLWNLETLDMRNSKIACLPKGIWKLQKLRRLYLNGPTYLPGIDNEVALPNLEVLTGIVLNQDSESLFAEARFPNQRKLGLCTSNVLESGLITLSLSSIHPLRHLRTLKICKSIQLSNLSSLQLTLTKLTLQDVRVHSPSMWRVLGSLNNLQILKVVECNRFTLYCYETSFCQLKVFKMAKVTHTEWGMEKGAMPSLQHLILERCQFCVMPPDELWCLSALRDVEVFHPDPKLAKWLQHLQLRDGCKLQVYPPLDPLPTTN